MTKIKIYYWKKRIISIFNNTIISILKNNDLDKEPKNIYYINIKNTNIHTFNKNIDLLEDIVIKKIKIFNKYFPLENKIDNSYILTSEEINFAIIEPWYRDIKRFKLFYKEYINNIKKLIIIIRESSLNIDCLIYIKSYL